MEHLTAIVAMNHQAVIGCQNALPWRLRRDMRFFREETTGHLVLMGRKTFDSLGRKCLPNRHNIVISHSFGLFPENDSCRCAHGIEDALFLATRAPKRYKKVFVIGGASIYDQLAPFVDRYLVTLVDKIITDGDAVFSPPFDPSDWDSTVLFSQPADAENDASFTVYEMVAKPAARAIIRDRRNEAIHAGRIAAEGLKPLQKIRARKAAVTVERANFGMF